MHTHSRASMQGLKNRTTLLNVRPRFFIPSLTWNTHDFLPPFCYTMTIHSQSTRHTQKISFSKPGSCGVGGGWIWAVVLEMLPSKM
ncbi:unnamed protein product [Boreogadus saida]